MAQSGWHMRISGKSEASWILLNTLREQNCGESPTSKYQRLIFSTLQCREELHSMFPPIIINQTFSVGNVPFYWFGFSRRFRKHVYVYLLRGKKKLKKRSCVCIRNLLRPSSCYLLYRVNISSGNTRFSHITSLGNQWLRTKMCEYCIRVCVR